MQQTSKIFPNAQTYPIFFNSNLVQPGRVIKYLHGKNCTPRAFYYQLLKLIFQLEVRKDGEVIDYEKLLVESVQRCVGSRGKSGDAARDLARDLGVVEQFIRQVSQNEDVQYEEVIQHNTVIDRAFINIFSFLIEDAGLSDCSVQEIIGYLSEIFGLRVTQIQKCIKFQESDIFLYVQSQSDLFLAYLNFQQFNQEQNSIQKAMENKSSNLQKLQKKVIKTQNDTIINIFGDMLHSSKYDENSKVSNSFLANNLNNSMSPAKRQQQHFNNNNMKTNKLSDRYKGSLAYLDSQQKEVSSKTTNDTYYNKNQSKVQDYQLPPTNIISNPTFNYLPNSTTTPAPAPSYSTNTSTQPQKPPSPQPLYRPKSLLPSLHTISQVTASKQSLIQSQKNKRDQLNHDEDERGTFYRQFTDTRILNILPEPQRTNVRMLKNRFFGLRSRDLRQAMGY